MEFIINKRDVDLAVLAINRMNPKDQFELKEGVTRLMTAAITELASAGDYFEAYGVLIIAANGGKPDCIRVLFTIPCNEVCDYAYFREE